MDKKSLMILCDIEAGRRITLYPEAGGVEEVTMEINIIQ